MPREEEAWQPPTTAFPACGNVVIVVTVVTVVIAPLLLLLLSSVPRLDSRLRIGDNLSAITFYFVGVISREAACRQRQTVSPVNRRQLMDSINTAWREHGPMAVSIASRYAISQ